MKDHCSVAIILPTYNRLTYLRAAVDSVFAQTFNDWELIIADDGSGAETLSYLSELAGNPRVKVLYLVHTGNPGAVRNIAMRASRSDYLAFMDSDDLWLPSKLSAQLALHQANRTRRWNYTALLRIDAEGRALPTEFPGRRVVREGAIFAQLLTFEVAMTPTCVFAERSLVEELGGFDEAQLFYEDYDLLLRMSLRSEAGAIAQQLTQVRNHAQHYSADRARVHEWRFRLLDKVAAEMATTAEHHAIVRAERARNALTLARLHAVAGRRREALGMIWRGSPARLDYWPKAAAIALRAVAPAKVTAIVRGLRRALGAGRTSGSTPG
jgi:glycosyltransferase involved in cell wall biosynthesis